MLSPGRHRATEAGRDAQLTVTSQEMPVFIVKDCIFEQVTAFKEEGIGLPRDEAKRFIVKNCTFTLHSEKTDGIGIKCDSQDDDHE